jgi:hypothetical protein
MTFTREDQRDKIRAQLIFEITHDSGFYKRYESKSGLCKRAKFLKNPNNVKTIR